MDLALAFWWLLASKLASFLFHIADRQVVPDELSQTELTE